MDVMFKCYTPFQFADKFKVSNQFFGRDVIEVFIFRPNGDKSGLCFAEMSYTGTYTVHGCGIDEHNLNSEQVLRLIIDTIPQRITDKDIKIFLEMN